MDTAIIGGLVAFAIIFWLTPKFMGAAWRKRDQDRFDAMFGYRRRK